MLNMITYDSIKLLCNDFYSHGKLGKDYAIIFVYNNTDNADDFHRTECVYPIEQQMIEQSFRKIAQFVYSFNSEIAFIKAIDQIKFNHTYLLVYSMAQNVDGVGRRALIPLLCKYYNIINVGSDEYASFLSGDKRLMHKLLENNSELHFPKTVYINKYNVKSIENMIHQIPVGRYIVKPIDESASIGVKLIELCSDNSKQIYADLLEYSENYSSFCIQEYIDGYEVEVPIIKIGQDYFCPGVCRIVFEDNINYLDYDTVGLDSYGFTRYPYSDAEIISDAVSVAKNLQFNCISRIDFRIMSDIPYIIDIGANPTISTHSSTNYLFKNLSGDESSVYHLLVIRALMQEGLFKPSFNQTKQNR